MYNHSMLNSENIIIKSQLGGMQVLEYKRDMSVSPYTSKTEYYASKMNVQRRQVLLNLNGKGYTVQDKVSTTIFLYGAYREV